MHFLGVDVNCPMFRFSKVVRRKKVRRISRENIFIGASF